MQSIVSADGTGSAPADTWLYDKFINHNLHTARKTDQYRAALSTDLVIEQKMMKALKGRGGLTRSWHDRERSPAMGAEHAQMC